jgi:hypothetical protein
MEIIYFTLILTLIIILPLRLFPNALSYPTKIWLTSAIPSLVISLFFKGHFTLVNFHGTNWLLFTALGIFFSIPSWIIFIFIVIFVKKQNWVILKKKLLLILAGVILTIFPLYILFGSEPGKGDFIFLSPAYTSAVILGIIFYKLEGLKESKISDNQAEPIN